MPQGILTASSDTLLPAEITKITSLHHSCQRQCKKWAILCKGHRLL